MTGKTALYDALRHAVVLRQTSGICDDCKKLAPVKTITIYSSYGMTCATEQVTVCATCEKIYSHKIYNRECPDHGKVI